ncbi:unnamed protein product [Parajaminaea phylloscopi]
MSSFTIASGPSSSSTNNMRGLVSYIAALRQARHREAEEKVVRQEMAHIRNQFRGTLNGYQKKKYLSKIVFTYILGYPVDIGHMEAINLIASSKYSEKQIGYLALTLLMNEGSDLVRLVVNSIRKDLDDLNEVHNCLALHAIANIGGEEMAETLANDVHRLLISPTSRSFARKKAALTLLRLYRKNPEAIPAEEWAPRVVAIMDDENLGVATAVASLVMALAQDLPDAFSIAYPKAVDRLAKIVVEEDFSEDYIYYKVPAPWLQVKLLRLLQYWPPSEDESVRNTLNNVLEHIVMNSQNSPKNVQHNNAQNAILFEAINLAIHLDTESSVVSKASVLLGRFILSRETNVRYLGLDTMAHLAACAESLEPIKLHQSTIILSLRDKDISVRRRGLDLLYSMCDVDNARKIVAELLRYLQVADYALREELVLKIAILTEKFATEHNWYVDTILQLISSAGDHVGEEVWFRVIQIVTNNEEVQQYAATKAYEHLRSSSCHENLIKVGGYVLGEYGHLIANEPGASPIEQFHALHSRSHMCSQPTRALLLSTYVKWLNLFPEIREQILFVLNRYRHVLDAELQQRACEYVALAEMPNDELLQSVCDEMPPFPEKSSLLLGRLQKKHGDTNDKRTWIIGGKEVNRNRQDVRQESLKKGQVNGGAMPSTNGAQPTVIPAGHHAPDLTTAGANQQMGATSRDATDDILAGLEGLDMSGSNGAPAYTPGAGLLPSGQPAESNTLASQPLIDTSEGGERSLLSPSPSPSPSPSSPVAMRHSSGPTSTAAPSALVPAVTGLGGTAALPSHFTPNTERAFHRISFATEGVLYEDSQLQVGIKSEYHGHQGRLALYLGNKISANFESLTISVRSSEPDALAVSLSKMAPTTLGAMTQVQQVVQLECKDVFRVPPVLRISYLAGSLHEITLRLPVVLTKFIEPVTLSSHDFFERWKQIGPAPREMQKIFSGFKLDASGQEVDIERQRKLVSSLRVALLDGVDPKRVNVVGAGVLHTSSAGKVGCLLRVEPNAQAKLCRATVRTTNDVVSSEVCRLAVCALSNDVQGLINATGPAQATGAAA